MPGKLQVNKPTYSPELQFGKKIAPRKRKLQGAFAIIVLMEKEPVQDNVVYLDEYPHLEEKLRLQRLSRPAVQAALHDMTRIIKFELPEPPDQPA